MDIKSKKFSRHIGVKILAFVLALVSIVSFVTLLLYVDMNQFDIETLMIKEYDKSETFLNRELVSTLYLIKDAVEDGKNIHNPEGYRYFVTDGENNYSNTIYSDEANFSQSDYSFSYSKDSNWKSLNKEVTSINSYYTSDKIVKAYLAFDNDYMKAKQVEWEEKGRILRPLVLGILSSVLLGLFLIIYLIIVTGRKTNDDELHLSVIDRTYSDVLLALFIPFGILWFSVMNSFAYQLWYSGDSFGFNEILTLGLISAVTAFVASVYGILLLSIVRKIKARKLIKHSMIYIVIYNFFDLIKSLFDGRKFSQYPHTKSLFYRQWVFIVASAFSVFLFALFLVVASPLSVIPFIGEMVLIYWFIKGNRKTFEEIDKGISESVEEQMKAERMKIDLITNVSHDLKTPLTSIISYVDLLGKEEELSDSSREYIQVLSDKTERLKNIVSDLFDLSKSTSGNISMEMEYLDIKKLIEQTLADMSDQIESSEFNVVRTLPEKPVIIYSDGKKLYRVFQNIIDNALKYSLSGTRIFVELSENENEIIASIKNTALYEMNFTEEEILQRFNRGDKSRTTEGSGLGLSIAESFITVSGGRLNIEIDGDQFKINLIFKKD